MGAAALNRASNIQLQLDDSTLQRKEAHSKILSTKAAQPIQLELDEDLAGSLREEGYNGPVNGQYMAYTGENSSGEDVDWKAHIGVIKANRAAAVAAVSTRLKALDVSHKFDVNDAASLPKFVTIYPPAEQEQWAGIISSLEGGLSGIGTIVEESTEAVGAGLVSMRHGQITALTADKIAAAEITLTKGRTQAHPRGNIVYYTINEAEKRWEGQAGEFAHVSFMGAYFFMTPAGPKAAVIWDGQLRADPRAEWNPFEIALPEGLRTTEDILTAQEAEVDRAVARVSDSTARINALAETEERSMMSTDARLVNQRNAKQDREYVRLGQYKDRAERAETVLGTVLSPADKVARRDIAIEKIRAVKIEIAKQTRRLDVMF